MSLFPTTERPGVASPNTEQAPLGEHPSYDDVLDVAVQYTFPCSDPIACDGCCADARLRQEREEGAALGPGRTAGHGEAVNLGEG